MSIYKLIIIVLTISSIVIMTFSTSYANCQPNYQWSAEQFLKDCAKTGDNVWVDPSWAGKDSMHALIVNIAEWVISFGALFAIGAIVFSGVQYTTSYGDDEKVKKAKMTGIYAITGLLLLLVAFPMVNIVIDFIYEIWSK
jgi:hypothetical protein